MAEQIEMPFGFWTWVGRMKRQQCGLTSNYFDQFLFKTVVLFQCHSRLDCIHQKRPPLSHPFLAAILQVSLHVYC